MLRLVHVVTPSLVLLIIEVVSFEVCGKRLTSS